MPRNFQKINSIIIAISFQFALANPVNAQMNRAAQGNDIISNIYQNSSHAITGAILQGVMLNQNNSYVNILSDTNLLDLRLFSPYATYTPGMGAFYGDTLFMDASMAHGTWTRSDWIEISSGGCICSSYLKYADTTGGVGENKVVTPYYVSVHYIGDSGLAGSSSVIVTHAKPRVVSLPSSGVTPGTGNYVTVNNKGIVTAVIDSIIAAGSNVTISRAGGVITISATNPYSDTLPTGKLLTGTKGLQVGGQNFNNSPTACKWGPLDSSQINMIIHGVRAMFISYFKHGNTTEGYGAGENLTIASDTFGLVTSTGTGNTVFGIEAGNRINGHEDHSNPNEQGINMTCIGAYAGTRQHWGDDATYIGKYAGFSDTNGVANTIVGCDAGLEFQGAKYRNVNGGRYNTWLGKDAGYGSVLFDTASYDVGLGGYAQDSLKSGQEDVAVGYFSEHLVTTGINNTGLGGMTLQNLTTGNNNSCGGFGSGAGLTTGGGNTLFGYETGFNGNGNNNTAFGFSSLKDNIGGGNNAALGENALFSNTTGGSNTAEGVDALEDNTIGFFNVANGTNALLANTVGVDNTANGAQCLSNNNGDRNVAVGDSVGTICTGCNRITLIGAGANVSSASLSNATALGDSAIATASNTMQLGNSKVVNVNMAGALSVSIDTTRRTGGTKTVAQGKQVLIMTGGADSTITINFPSAPVQGQIFIICGTASFTRPTFSSAGNTFANAPSAIVGGTALRFIYYGTVWYNL